MIFGLNPKNPLPEGWVPLEAAAVIKCLDEEGNPALYLSHTENLSTWESLGMLTIARRTVEDELADGFIEDEDDELG
jgi:hypothetical protein